MNALSQIRQKANLHSPFIGYGIIKWTLFIGGSAASGTANILAWYMLLTAIKSGSIISITGGLVLGLCALALLIDTHWESYAIQRDTEDVIPWYHSTYLRIFSLGLFTFLGCFSIVSTINTELATSSPQHLADLKRLSEIEDEKEDINDNIKSNNDLRKGANLDWKTGQEVLKNTSIENGVYREDIKILNEEAKQLRANVNNRNTGNELFIAEGLSFLIGWLPGRYQILVVVVFITIFIEWFVGKGCKGVAVHLERFSKDPRELVREKISEATSIDVLTPYLLKAQQDIYEKGENGRRKMSKKKLQRHEAIKLAYSSNPLITNIELAEMFNVTPETICRDRNYLGIGIRN